MMNGHRKIGMAVKLRLQVQDTFIGSGSTAQSFRFPDLQLAHAGLRLEIPQVS